MAKSSLNPIPVELNTAMFSAICSWPYPEEFVARMLAGDIPQRVKYGFTTIWAYQDDAKYIVGFGTLSVCEDYRELTDDKPHLYIPLLAVHPAKRGLGHGRAIVDHLAEEATCVIRDMKNDVRDALFLDVYEDSVGAISLYKKSGFETIGDPITDPVNGKAFRVMAKRLSNAA